MLQAFLLGCIAFIGKCDLATGTNLIQRPIFTLSTTINNLYLSVTPLLIAAIPSSTVLITSFTPCGFAIFIAIFFKSSLITPSLAISIQSAPRALYLDV